MIAPLKAPHPDSYQLQGLGDVGKREARLMEDQKHSPISK